MTVGLFVPCYVEQFYPHVAIATLELLEKYGCDVEIPDGQTCCGQPLANAGFDASTGNLVDRFTDVFSGFDYVVSPSASCVVHVVEHHHATTQEPAASARFVEVRERTYEVCQFLYDVLGVKSVDVSFEHRVGLHMGCHGLRSLRLGPDTEMVASQPDRVRELLSSVDGLTLVDLQRPDECCGFGGTFSVSEEAISVRMGQDRLADHTEAGAEYVASTDMSCLMHLQGLSSRTGAATRFVHVAEILNGRIDE